MAIEHGLPFPDYRRIQAVNWSSLRPLEVSPLHYQWELDAPDLDSEALIIGRAVHTAVLEPDLLDKEYASWAGGYTTDGRPTTSRNSNDYKKFKASVPEGVTILADEERTRVLGAAAAVYRHREATRILEDSDREITCTWVDDLTGIKCKCRVDIHTNRGRIADLKTSSAIAPHEFESSVHRYGYAGQLAYYRDGAEQAGLKVSDELPALVVVDSRPPHDCIVYRMSPDLLEYGRNTYRALLNDLAACRKTNQWPGIAPEGEIELQLPSWVTSLKP